MDYVPIAKLNDCHGPKYQVIVNTVMHFYRRFYYVF